MGFEFGWGRASKTDHDLSQFDLRSTWEVGDVAGEFYRLFHVGLLGFVGHVEKVFAPPQSTGLLFEFGPGMREEFAKLIADRAFPPKTAGGTSPPDPNATTTVVPDNPGFKDRDAWWRQAASGAAIGASFREAGTQTSVHIAFNDTECDVHVDRNGFIVTEGGYTHWDLNNLLRHMTVDLAGDKLPWVLGSVTYLNSKRRPLFQATLSPWLAVDLPSRDAIGPSGIKIGLAVSGIFQFH